jgi:hypothetical protein
MNKRFNSLALLLLLLPVGGLSAATVSLVPEDPVVAPGSITVDLVLEASDVADGCDPRCSDFAGHVVVSFDPAGLTFVGFAAEQPANLIVGPTTETGTVTIGFDDALESGIVGSFEFLVTAEPGTGVALGLADTQPLLGSFEYEQPTNQFFFPDFVGTELQVVPLPAAAWLFLSALGAAVARVRRAG